MTRDRKEKGNDNEDHPMGTVTNKRNVYEFPEIIALRCGLMVDNGSRSAPNSRSSSFRNRGKPKHLRLRFEEPRRKSLPSAVSCSHLRSSEDSAPIQRVRSFKLTSKGLENRGDSFRRKSSSSVTSSSGSSGRVTRCRIPSDTSEASVGDSSVCTTGTCCSLATEYFRVVVLGDSGVGKSSMINQFRTSEYMGETDNSSLTEPESDCDVTVSVLLDGEEATLEFTDTLGSWKENIGGSMDAFLVVFAVDNKKSFTHAQEILQYLRNTMATDRPILLVANKSDLVRHRHVKIEDAKRVAEEYNCKLSEVSVAINHKVDELLVGILRQIRLKLHALPENVDNRRKLTRRESIFRKFFKRSFSSSKSSCENLFDP